MLTVRRAQERGISNLGWLDSRHSFSFAEYYDPSHMGFRKLRVINDDRVAPGGGFGTHGHRDMEIISYVVEGGLAHKDSMGNGSTITPGDVQRMTAGTGVMHSEFNHSKDQKVRFLQIWIQPERGGLPPSYEQKKFPEEQKQGVLKLLASRNGEDGSVTVHQDVRLFGAVLESGQEVQHELAQGRHAWVQVVRGQVRVNGELLKEGDGLAVSNEKALQFSGVEKAELLLFDLA